MAAETRTDTELVEELVRRARVGFPAFIDAITDRRFREVPSYASGAAGTYPVVRHSAEANVEDILDGLLGVERDLAAPAETGRLRAQQGVPLADVLTSFRMLFHEVWDKLRTVSRLAPAIPSDIMVDLSDGMFRLHNRAGDTLIHAYRDEAQHLLLTRERERAALINVLLSDNVGLATVVEIAEMLRLPMEGAFVVVAAGTQLGQDPIPRVDSYLAAIDVSSVWYLKQDALVGVLSLGQPARNDAALEVLGRHASGPIGASPLFAPLRRAAWALGLARLVLQRHPGGPTVQQFQDNPMNVLVASAPDAAQETSRLVLGGLLELPADRRDMLLETLNAWVEAGGSAQATGELLCCHPNTVRHRLRRIELATDRSLAHPGHVAELVAACRAWTQLPDPTRTSS